MLHQHVPPAGENMIQHHRASEDCPCKPREVPQYKQASRGRYGRHQGYQVTLIKWRHNPILTSKKKEA